MRKVYVLQGWTPQSGSYVSGVFTSHKKAEHAKNVLEKAANEAHEAKLYNIQTEILL